MVLASKVHQCYGVFASVETKAMCGSSQFDECMVQSRPFPALVELVMNGTVSARSSLPNRVIAVI